MGLHSVLVMGSIAGISIKSILGAGQTVQAGGNTLLDTFLVSAPCPIDNTGIINILTSDAFFYLSDVLKVDSLLLLQWKVNQ